MYVPPCDRDALCHPCCVVSTLRLFCLSVIKSEHFRGFKMDSVEVKVLAHAEGIAVFVGTETVLVRC